MDNAETLYEQQERTMKEKLQEITQAIWKWFIDILLWLPDDENPTKHRRP